MQHSRFSEAHIHSLSQEIPVFMELESWIPRSQEFAPRSYPKSH